MGADAARRSRHGADSLDVTPTHTIYTFHAAQVTLTVTFFTPAFPKDLDVLSRPVTYLTLRRHRRRRDHDCHAAYLMSIRSSP